MGKKMKINELKKLPFKEWRETKRYNQILIIRSGKKHDSGWSIIYIIGCKKGKPVEIVGGCDDIGWDVSEISDEYSLRSDMYYPSGVLRFWSNRYDFEIGLILSSTTIKLVPRKENDKTSP